MGCGAGGSVLLQRLARAGWRVAALDAGPFWDPNPALTIMAVAARAADHLIAGAPA